MGLDMYLEKTKKITENLTGRELHVINDYLDWKERGKDYSFSEWCGHSVREVDLNLASEYRKEYIQRYSRWDTEHRYGYNSIFQPVHQWRKANHIHNWFVENVQGGTDDCGIYVVTEEDLLLLNELCKEVLDSSRLVEGKIINGYTINENGEVPIYEDGEYIEDSAIAQELLPTVSGFFFGSQEYDQWYYRDVEDTYNITKELLEETDFSKEVVLYSSSW